MKKRYPLPVLFLVFSLSSCGTARQVQPVERVSKDTLYLSNVQYDSVYVFQNHLTDRTRDTVYIHDVRYEYKYKLLRDTVYKVQVDTIPVIRTVEVVKTKWSPVLVIVFVLLFVVYLLWKIKF